MPFAVQREHYILSPYFDYLSFFFNKSWRYPASDTLSLGNPLILTIMAMAKRVSKIIME